MTAFVTSDIHFNHVNILKYQPNRGTDDLSHMNEMIIKNWNEDVSPEDEVYILGDVAMGRIEFAPELIRRLNGTKYLVAGNHDKSLRKLIKTEAWNSDLFAWVETYYEMVVKVDGKKYMLCMSHFPMAHWNGQANGNMMLHGHLHGAPSNVTGRIRDVGMDTNGMRPYNLENLVRELTKVEVRGNHHGD